MFTFPKGRSVIVTGAGSGIGRCTAGVFAASGAKVLLVDLDEEKVKSAAQDLLNEGYAADFIRADIGNLKSVEGMAEKAVKEFGGIDVLCCNAAVFPSGTIEEISVEDWDKTINTNLKGAFLCVRACLPALKKSQAGRIILTSSITGPFTGVAGWSNYSASKAGQMGFLRSAALELAPLGITINAVMPGNVLTEGLIAQGAEYRERMTAAIPMGRLAAPEEIANTMLFLSTPEAGYITGQGLVIDGGQLLPEG